MPLLALGAVLLAAGMHATWNLVAKRAAEATHFVWLYSLASVVIWTPLVVWSLGSGVTLGPRELGSLFATSVLHLGYSLVLQAGYRAADLSVVYPVARGTGPLLSFFAAVLLFGEDFDAGSVAGVLLVVAGIVLVSGLARGKVSLRGVGYGLVTGAFIAAYTVNDGFAVKRLGVPPVFVDYAGNLFRVFVLLPGVLKDRARVPDEWRRFGRHALVVGFLGPLGYVLVLYAMTVAPVSHVAPARELATLVGAVLGARVLAEEAGPSRILGAACIVAGVICLALT